MLLILLLLLLLCQVSLGYAGYAGGVIGFSTFGPQFAMALGFFDSEAVASTFFGALMAVAGLLGTPFGGKILDSAMAWGQDRGWSDLEVSCMLSLVENGLGAVVVLGVCFAETALLFNALLFVGCLGLFASTAPMNLAIMESVPVRPADWLSLTCSPAGRMGVLTV